ncbi:hypothetical protein BH20ACI4_BH20ACI4_23670 [soil metagenome]
MKNKFVIVISGVLLFGVLGCGISDRIQKAVEDKPANTSSDPASSNDKTIGDKATENVLREKTGVAECDELLDWLADQSKSKDDNYVSKAMKEYFYNKIRQSIKESIEKNQNDKEKMAKECKEIKQQIDDQKAKEETNK